MTKAVFTTKVHPTYDDLPEVRYHFPRTYLNQVRAAVGDWVIYYEPRRLGPDDSSRGGRQAYFATARVRSLESDPRRDDHFYAFVTDYLDFDHPVPFREGTHFYESGLKRPDGETSKGAFGRAVRPISEVEYELILRTGFSSILNEVSGEIDHNWRRRLAEEPATFERPISEFIVARPFRNRAFSGKVRFAYASTCAMTGLKIINGGGRAEVQAAHIRPVADDGPDSVRNGIALCGTVHWMFDRGLISVSDDYKILTAQGGVPDEIRRLLNTDGRLHLPARSEFRPHPQFLRYHREQVFKY